MKRKELIFLSIIVIYACVLLQGITHVSGGNYPLELDYHFRVPRQAVNPECRFRCGNDSACIPVGKICDGIVDCTDGSDEADSCKRYRCPKYLFRCDYGACITKSSRCNGEQNCRDNSDEKDCHKDLTSPDTCGERKFRCDNGQCIDELLKCDGKADCADTSDESVAACSHLRCYRYLFRCDYGACINKDKYCNGVRDCFDGSDEPPGCDGGSVQPPVQPPIQPPVQPPVVTPTPPPPAGGCVLPEPPAHGFWTLPTNKDLGKKPGDYVEESTLLVDRCHNDFILVASGASYIICMNGAWSRKPGICERICPPLRNTPKMTVECIRNEFKVSCSEPKDGTLARFQCAAFYEDLSLLHTPTRFCQDGSWNAPAPNCVPECGNKDGPTPLIIGGNVTKMGDYPWQMAIYERIGEEEILICGGSLVNTRVIVTAAHCVTDGDTSEIKDKNLYTIGAGKYYRPIDDPRDEHAQYLKVKEIFVPESYAGFTLKYVSDIAVVVVDGTFEINRYVQPICIDWGEDFDQQVNQTGAKGLVTGWGYTARGKDPSERLKQITVDYIAPYECKESLPLAYKDYLTYDKICSGFQNQEKGVCQGDSGGGLVFKNAVNGRFYLRGIVSLSPQSTEDSCDPNQYALYTAVSKHIFFIAQRDSVSSALAVQ